ncbi:DUF853 family protein [Myxococcota bacterium]|nr:DUF853 family protein [Myxococcota bacterium]
MPTLSLGRDEAGAAVVFAPEDLRTHGVVVGMTGSGKTGLSIVVLEELARAGVPIIAIDPKGDLGNLAFLFGALSAEEFAPWVEPGADPGTTAAAWREGLAGSGLSAADVAALRDRVQVTVYTPGSEAGVPVDVLGAFRRPTQAAAADPDTLRAVVAGTVSGLLGLVGRDSDPVRDPAHIVLSQVLEQAWAAGEDPDLETLILRLVDPPFEKVGVFPLDRFFSPDDRMALAMQLNGIVAAPSFQAWTRGAPLDLVALLGGPEGPPPGRVPVHVFTLAHLADPQRQLFLSLLLSGLRAWSRALPGTSGLRAVLFFDEVAGYLPPHPYDPPTKEPLLTLMKQARAVGLGVLLSTQNPVDLDYKALSNAGLWFVGRLQTKQDRDRLLSGLGRPDLDEAVASLGRRRFLVVDAKSDQPRTFATRHAMAFLRGPLTSVEIGRLKAPAAKTAPRRPPPPRPPPPRPSPPRPPPPPRPTTACSPRRRPPPARPPSSTPASPSPPAWARSSPPTPAPPGPTAAWCCARHCSASCCCASTRSGSASRWTSASCAAGTRWSRAWPCRHRWPCRSATCCPRRRPARSTTPCHTGSTRRRSARPWSATWSSRSSATRPAGCGPTRR